MLHIALNIEYPVLGVETREFTSFGESLRISQSSVVWFGMPAMDGYHAKCKANESP
jgi:hypothetical protein